MAQLKIYNDIQSNGEKDFMRLMGATEGVSYTDIHAFVASIPEEDNEIDIRLHCDGGSVSEGWAIYDCLRMSGKEITATIEGTCASMATVILMAAPKERRNAYANAHILLHNPWLPPIALGDKATGEDLEKAGRDLLAEQNRMVDLYVERTGCERETIQRLMDEDKFIGADEALELGIIGHIIPPITASVTKPKYMEVKESLMQRMLAKLGFKTIDEASALESPEIVAMRVNTEDGVVLTIDREEGEPQVGDNARPDGEHKTPDGETIVVADGVIVEIRPSEPTAEEDEPTDDKKGEDDVSTEEVKEEEVVVVEKEDDDEEQRLRDRIAELEAENEELRTRIAELEGNAKTDEDARLLALLEQAGGEEALAKISSTYVPEGRQPKGIKATNAVTANDILAKYNSVYKK